jgi:hypothetical protein
MTPEAKKRLRERIEQMLDETDKRPQFTIDELESLLLHIRDEVTEAAREEINRELAQETDQTELDSHESSSPATKVLCPHCQKANAWYKGKRTRQVVTLVGILLLHRAYYYCRRCKHGICPEDTARHLPPDTDFSTRVEQETAYLSACLPFAQAVSTFSRLCGVSVSPASAERLCRTRGASLTQDFVKERDKMYLPLAFTPCSKALSLLPHPEVLYLAADGIQTPLQGGSWKEMKVGVVQSTFRDGRVDQASRYVNFLGDCETFGEQWEALAISAGSLQAKRVVVLGDGAAWIWNLAQKRFPRAIQILDFWHALEYVAKVAREAFEESSLEGKQWLSSRAFEMKRSDWSSFHAALEAVHGRAVDSVTDVVRYFGNNASRMDYARYMKMGLSIGSGIAESSCKPPTRSAGTR